MTDWRALCEELADKLDHVRPSTFDPPDCLIRARAALAEPVGEPAPPDAGEVGELVAWLRETGRLLSRRPDIQCRVELRLFDRAADLLERQAALAAACGGGVEP